MCVCACVCACVCVCVSGRAFVYRSCNIMDDVYLYHSYILQCLVFAGRPIGSYTRRSLPRM